MDSKTGSHGMQTCRQLEPVGFQVSCRSSIVHQHTNMLKSLDPPQRENMQARGQQARGAPPSEDFGACNENMSIQLCGKYTQNVEPFRFAYVKNHRDILVVDAQKRSGNIGIPTVNGLTLIAMIYIVYSSNSNLAKMVLTSKMRHVNYSILAIQYPFNWGFLKTILAFSIEKAH